MNLEENIGYCLASQQIREAVEEGIIITGDDFEERIQPSSFEPIIGDEVHIIYTDLGSVFRPDPKRTVLRSLSKLPSSQRSTHSITSGFELKKGFSYLIPLEDRINIPDLPKQLHVKASPKSSFGRLFLNTRLIGDYADSFDEINYNHNDVQRLWLLVEPLAFNVIIHPGISLNQLRFIHDYSAILNHDEILEEWKRNPFFFHRNENGDEIPITDPTVTSGVYMHLDLSGKNTHGVIALRARNNPAPIDLAKVKEYDIEDFFEPIMKKGSADNYSGFTVKPGEHFLFASHEILRVPHEFNVELARNDHAGFSGPLHFAGFIDNGFTGDLVFEARSDEVAGITLDDRMPISKIDIFKTKHPDKLYGNEIGSNYQGQIGCKPSKHFKDVDYQDLAKKYKLLNRRVLVQERNILLQHHTSDERFAFLESPDSLFEDITSGFFHFRHHCEGDDLLLQPIPYVLVFGPDDTIFSYKRADKIEKYGDDRLFGKHSLGLGGHIRFEDKPNFVLNCIKRELSEEVEIPKGHSDPKLVGTLYATNELVDCYHFGLIYVCKTSGSVSRNEESIESGRLIKIDELFEDPDRYKKYETWSQALFPKLREIYKLV